MGATFHYDPTAKQKSPMLRQLPLCDGQRKGFECKHLWRHVVRMSVLNPENLRKGQTFRYCKLAMHAPDHNMAMFIDGDEEMAVECTEYKRDWFRRYDPRADEYKPLTPEEIVALQDGKAIPRFRPKRWWQFWRRTPVAEVVYLTPEEAAAAAIPPSPRQTTASEMLGNESVFSGSVFDEKTPETPESPFAAPPPEPAPVFAPSSHDADLFDALLTPKGPSK